MFMIVQIESNCNKINAIQNIKFVFNRVKNIMGKGENAGNVFSPYLQKALKVGTLF